jgi:hypothetical protein
LREVYRSPGEGGKRPGEHRGRRPSAVKSGSRRLADIQVQGTTAGYGALMNLDLVAGRYFVEREDASAQAVTVIGWDVKEEPFPQ